MSTPTEAGWYWFEGTVAVPGYSTACPCTEFIEVSQDSNGTFWVDDDPSLADLYTGTWYGPLDVERIKAMHSVAEEVDPVYGVGWAQ